MVMMMYVCDDTLHSTLSLKQTSCEWVLWLESCYSTCARSRIPSRYSFFLPPTPVNLNSPRLPIPSHPTLQAMF